MFPISLFLEREGSFDDAWWQAGGPMVLVGLSLGVVYGHLLTVAPAPLRNRR